MPLAWTSLAAMALASTCLAANHVVEVGRDEMGNLADAFNPPVLQADSGDTVTFRFYRGEHNVVHSSQNTACSPAPGGWHSPEVDTESNMNDMEYVLTINNTNPMYYYCSEYSHCNLGMVGVINGPRSGYMTYRSDAASADIEEPDDEDEAVGGVWQTVSSGGSGGGSGGGGSGGGGSGGGMGGGSGGSGGGMDGSATIFSISGVAVAVAAVACAAAFW